MIISKTPYRISFVGGGTDLRSFYREEPGQVLSTTIDRYLYVVVKRQLGIVEFKYRVNWSKVEFKNQIDDIEHPLVRAMLKKMEIDFPIEITTFADIPASTGLGSSSAFAVGLLHALYTLKNKTVTKNDLASEAAQIEIDVLKRFMGKQDHYASTYGNFNVFTFHPDETATVEPIYLREDVKEQLKNNLYMFYTALKRDASEILENQNRETDNKREVLRKMRGLVAPMREIMTSGGDLDQIGSILHEGWKLKKSLTQDISTTAIDEYYAKARSAGAIGGKLLGAGGGGFLLFYARPEKKDAVIKALSDLYHLPLNFDLGGSVITYHEDKRY